MCAVFSVLDWRWEAGAWREAKPGRVAPWAATFHFVVMGLLEGQIRGSLVRTPSIYFIDNVLCNKKANESTAVYWTRLES